MLIALLVHGILHDSMTSSTAEWVSGEIMFSDRWKSWMTLQLSNRVRYSKGDEILIFWRRKFTYHKSLQHGDENSQAPIRKAFGDWLACALTDINKEIHNEKIFTPVGGGGGGWSNIAKLHLTFRLKEMQGGELHTLLQSFFRLLSPPLTELLRHPVQQQFNLFTLAGEQLHDGLT